MESRPQDRSLGEGIIFMAWFLLFGIGVSNIGDWIYLIALNLIVLDLTGSPLAVAALYILKPMAALCTNFWAGSLIDRLNKRRLMLSLDMIRAFFIAILPLLPSIWLMYSFVFMINMAGAAFEPTSTVYITKLIPPRQRKRFNSMRSLVESGGFLTGPAIAGVLFLLGSPKFAIYMNAITFLISGLVTFFMPDIEKHHFVKSIEKKLSWQMLKMDWLTVSKFSRQSVYVIIIYLLFSGLMVLASATDSLEAAFSKQVLSLSNEKYGILVSIAGAGIAMGAISNYFIKKWPLSVLIGFGSVTVSIGYIIYAFSSGFFIAAVGFFTLSFALAFASSGFQTFYQTHIPVEIMGRFTSLYGIFEAVFVIVMTSLFGISAQFFSIRNVVIVGTLIMTSITVTLCVFNLLPSQSEFYQDSKRKEKLL